MSYHHLAYLIARCGFTMDTTRADYGYDGFIFTFAPNGEIENSYMFVQLKATDHLRTSRDGRRARHRINRKDVSLWQGEIFPVYLVVFDAKRERARWIYLQRYFQKHRIKAANMKAKSITIELARPLNENAIRSWRDDKIEMLRRIGTVDHA